ncbi:MAG: fumarylacetoacetate hydrolase family protein, partial [Chloroflexi bacterium]|nr:fumarylacetoacetate hydrolase family protein [Chloroflexota bacterium]
VGPWIETAIEPTDLGLRLRLNGQLRQDSRTSKMLFDVFTVIAFVSARIPLAAGDLVMTATPSGVGRIAPGDVVEVDIEGIGVVGNPVVLDPSVAERPLARI